MQSSWKPSLRTCLLAIVFVVLAPILGVVGMAIFNAGESYKDASTQQLLETARVVSQSVDSEIGSTTRLISGFSELQRFQNAVSGTTSNAVVLEGLDLQIYSVVDGEIVSAAPDTLAEGFRQVIIDAAATGETSLSNLVDMPGADAVTPMLMVALPLEWSASGSQIATVTGRPVELVRTLMRETETRGRAILAITDGNGRIIGRSVDGEQFVGRPVPDWAALKALNTDSGYFRAETIEGNQILFAFQAIAGTPGWMAVVGEPVASFDARWQDPIKTMVIASSITVLIALVLAVLLAQQVLRPISHLAKRAQAVASGADDVTDVDVPRSFVAEFETLRSSLDLADAKMEESLAESEAAVQVARDSAHALEQAERLARIGSWVLDLETGAFTSSKMLYELNGADPDGPQLTVADLQGLMPPEAAQRVQAAIARCVETGEPYGLEVEHLRADGHNFYAYIQGQRLCDETGRPVKLAGTVQDITERREERERLAALADNLPSGAIFRLERDPDGEVEATYISAGIERLIGVPAADITEQLDIFLNMVEPEDRAGLDILFDAPEGSGQILDYAMRVMTPERGLVWLHIRAALRGMLDGHLVWDGIVRDITGEREVAEALHAAKEAAVAAEKAKGDFLATMSHEIRTPMNTVIGMTRLALQTELDAKQRNYLEKINRAATVLLGIINDILDFSKIEAEGLQLEKTPFALESVLESVSAVTALRAEEKGLEIAFAVDRDLPTHLTGDALRLGQVLTNLVGNAVKFTEKGDILVSIRQRKTPDSERLKLEFSVRDSGIGLTEHQIEGLFRPFTQAESDTSRKYGGTGLGLAICKRLVELMGGDIRVESEPGLGSTFIFTAVFDPAEVSKAPVPLTAAAAQIRGRRILIIDDNQSAREALLDMVESFGMTAQAVSSGPAGLDLLRRAVEQGVPFDMVLLDWRMPEMDGIETARRIKADQVLPEMPAVLMVTAYGHQVVTQAVQDIGLQGVLLKPVTQSVMFNTILGALALPSPEQDEKRSEISVGMKHTEAAKLLAGKRVLVVDDNALNREVATDFLELVGIEVETAVDGVNALEVLEAHRFDVVLMDMHMPRMNGLDAVREIRKRSEWAALPVIALTAQARVEDHHASLEAGMTAHLTKPIDETALYTTLAKVLNLSAPSEANSDLEHAGNEASAQWAFDHDAVMRRFGGNAQRVERLIKGFLRDFGSTPKEIETLLEAGDHLAIAEIAHQIKGSASYVGATDLAQTAGALERSAREGEGVGVEQLTDMFVSQLSSCLAVLEAAAQPKSDEGAEHVSMPLAAAVDLVEQSLTLVARGDFAARDKLEALAAGLAASEHRALAQTSLERFDDLEIEASLESLETLKTVLGAQSLKRVGERA